MNLEHQIAKSSEWSLELDHVFVCVPSEAAGIDALTEFGLKLGSGNAHPGQGTANARFFFNNAYLELLRITDETEVRSDSVRPTCLWERVHWKVTGACPFGFCFRDSVDSPSSESWSTWQYDAPFLPDGRTIPVLSGRRESGEPLVFVLSGASPPQQYPTEAREPLEHATGHHRITRIAATLAGDGSVSSELARICQAGLLNVGFGAEYFLEIELDGARLRRSHDFRPTLPMAFAW